jgi:hypothetical protein
MADRSRPGIPYGRPVSPEAAHLLAALPRRRGTSDHVASGLSGAWADYEADGTTGA